MSNITASASLEQQSTRLKLLAVSSSSINEDTFIASTVEVSTAAQTLSYGGIITPGTVLIKNLAGSDDLLVSKDGGSTFKTRVKAGSAELFRFNVEDSLETITVQTVADTAGSLDGTYFVVEDVNAETWAIGDGTLTTSEDYEISVSTDLTDATAAEVAAAFAAAMQSDTAFSDLFSVAYNAATDDDLITINDKHAGTRTDIADTGTTGFTLSTTQQGAALPVVQIKSAGSSIVPYAVASY